MKGSAKAQSTPSQNDDRELHDGFYLDFHGIDVVGHWSSRPVTRLRASQLGLPLPSNDFAGLSGLTIRRRALV